ncbi:hypothetical protein V5N11_013049 [Cardamine amara subsp. amara]|uniref:Uncharacterized protein n=1 Tax=Cardamine amara subsp. amara TaxID=228776 RepID=A0ABD1ALQ4_CARAN
MKDTFLSSSKAFSDSCIFGRGVNPSATISKENKPTGSANNSHTYAHPSQINPPEFVAMKHVLNRGVRNANTSVVSEPEPSREPRKSWHQLFTHSTSVTASSNVNTISR